MNTNKQWVIPYILIIFQWFLSCSFIARPLTLLFRNYFLLANASYSWSSQNFKSHFFVTCFCSLSLHLYILFDVPEISCLKVFSFSDFSCCPFVPFFPIWWECFDESFLSSILRVHYIYYLLAFSLKVKSVIIPVLSICMLQDPISILLKALVHLYLRLFLCWIDFFWQVGNERTIISNKKYSFFLNILLSSHFAMLFLLFHFSPPLCLLFLGPFLFLNRKFLQANVIF